VTDDPIVSQDVVGDSHSSIVDASACMMSGKRLFKLITWYDNEWGYSSRVVDLMAKAMSLGSSGTRAMSVLPRNDHRETQ
jgi:glyceraldehyde 3-phosphate dehydrogenase